MTMSETVVQRPTGLSGQPTIAAPKHAAASHTEPDDAHAAGASHRRRLLRLPTPPTRVAPNAIDLHPILTFKCLNP